MSASVLMLHPKRHEFHRCRCGRPGCMFCDGGLGLCTVCGAFEGQLLPDCPGYGLAPWERDACYHGHLTSVAEVSRQRALIESLSPRQQLLWRDLIRTAEALAGTIGIAAVTVVAVTPYRGPNASPPQERIVGVAT
jgi:hypothetical protein